jgi:hypothetical protein
MQAVAAVEQLQAEHQQEKSQMEEMYRIRESKSLRCVLPVKAMFLPNSNVRVTQ